MSVTKTQWQSIEHYWWRPASMTVACWQLWPVARRIVSDEGLLKMAVWAGLFSVVTAPADRWRYSITGIGGRDRPIIPRTDWWRNWYWWRSGVSSNWLKRTDVGDGVDGYSRYSGATDRTVMWRWRYYSDGDSARHCWRDWRRRGVKVWPVTGEPGNG